MINRFEGVNSFLSNFYLRPIELYGIIFPSSEHAYQAAKSLDPKIWEKVATIKEPGEAKHFGKYKIKIRPDWEQKKIEIMKNIVRIKFNQHPDLKEKLLATGNKILIEGNWWKDTFWGVCNGIGKNHLGIILMELREEFRNARNDRRYLENRM